MIFYWLADVKKPGQFERTVQAPMKAPSMECFMSCCIRIRACSKPADFFDEIIPDEGLQL